MKKYVKPEVHFESFTLSQHIAACNLTLLTSDVVNCNATGTIDGDFLEATQGSTSGWFVDKNANCAVQVEDYCYTNGSVGLTSINS